MNLSNQIKNAVITFIFITNFVIFNNTNCNAQSWLWAKSHGGSLSDKARKVCTDASGNVYVAGTYSSSSISFGAINLGNSGSGDVYVVKYDPSGSPLWANKIGGAGNEEVGGICTDANGKVYILGSYTSNSISVAPFMSVSNTNSSSNVFLEIIDASGAPIIITSYAGTGWDYGYSCTYSNSQSALYICGSYDGATIDFFPFTLTKTPGAGDMFIAKLNISGPNITPAWAITTGAANSGEQPLGIVLDNTNSNIYVSGNFFGTNSTLIGSTTLLSNTTGKNSFLSKWSSITGAFQWALNFGSPVASPSSPDTENTGLAIDAADNCFLTGSFNCPVLGISTTTISNSGSFSSDGYLASFNSAGVFQWVKSTGGSANEKITGATCVGFDVCVSGSFSGTTAVIGTTTLTNTTPAFNSTDIFVGKYDSQGNFQWVTLAPGIASEAASDITSDALGNVYVVGNYNAAGATAFGTTTLSSLGSDDGYVAKIGCLTATISGLANVCAGNSATLTASGATSYTWSNGATTNSIIITPTANVTYSVLGAIGSCTGVSTNFSVTFLPANVNAGPNLNLFCNQSQVINATTNPPNPVSVSWTPSVGLNNSSILTPSVIATAPNTQYTVVVSLVNGCMASGAVTVSQYAPAPNICMVTVDSVGSNNLILWDKTAYPNADTFYVYRDIANNNYQLIGKVLSAASFGEFQDTVRSLYSANGDPKASSWRYKIAYIDGCGNVSAKSPFHKTLFVQNNNGNFTWNDYQIEGQPIPVPALNNYVFRRDNTANGNWQNIQMLSSISNAYTDPNYSTFAATADWRAETIWSIQCNSSYFKTNSAATVKRSKSNLSNNKMIGIKENNLEKYISVYPNPSNYFINLEVKFADSYDLVIENALGQTILQFTAVSGNKEIKVSHFDKGIYYLRIKSASGAVNKKIIIE